MDSPGETLCRACGLCCDGTLFRTVLLTDAEVEPARRRGLTVLEGTAAARFTQPCAQHQGGACAIYADRPSSCVGFRCSLLEKRTSGELSEDECLARVARLRALARSVRSAMPGAPERRTLRAEIDAHLEAEGARAAFEQAAWRRRNADLLMDLKSLEILVERDFIPPSRG